MNYIVYRKLKLAPGMRYTGGRLGKTRELVEFNEPVTQEGVTSRSRKIRVTYKEGVITSQCSIHAFVTWVLEFERSTDRRLSFVPEGTASSALIVVMSNLQSLGWGRSKEVETLDELIKLFKDAARCAHDLFVDLSEEAKFTAAVLACDTIIKNLDMRAVFKKACNRARIATREQRVHEELQRESFGESESFKMLTIWASSML